MYDGWRRTAGTLTHFISGPEAWIDLKTLEVGCAARESLKCRVVLKMMPRP